MKNILIAIALMLVLVGVVILIYPRDPGKTTLKLYSGAGLRRAVEALMAEFEKESGIKVEPDYGGSGIILSKIQLDKDADLFMPGDVAYVDMLQEKSGRVGYRAEVSYFIPTIIVQKGNPKQIKGLQDLVRKDVKVAMGKADACQIGRLSTKLLKKNGIDRSGITAKESLTVNELGVWVQMKDVDVSIVWDAIAANIVDDVDIIEIPADKNIISKVVVGQLSSSKHQKAGRLFMDFMSGEKGQKILKEKGFTTSLPESYKASSPASK